MNALGLKIEDLPETFEVFPTDEIYLFQENTGTFSKLEIPVNALSTYFHDKAITERLREKTNELIKLSGEFTKWLKDNYADEAYISANYSTKNHFYDIYYTLQANSALSMYLDEYATKDYGQYKLNAAKAEHESLRYNSATKNGDSIVREIELNEDINDDSADEEE